MEENEPTDKITEFKFDGVLLPVEFSETLDVTSGVKCDVYKFTNNAEKDLGLITIEKGCKTPLQRVLRGDRTIEGYITGSGTLRVSNSQGNTMNYNVDEGMQKPFSVVVKVGEIMQWEASDNADLLVYEICFPPYQDGRYENL